MVLKAFGPRESPPLPHLCVRAAVPRACDLLNIFLLKYVAEITMVLKWKQHEHSEWKAGIICPKYKMIVEINTTEGKPYMGCLLAGH